MKNIKTCSEKRDRNARRSEALGGEKSEGTEWAVEKEKRRRTE